MGTKIPAAGKVRNESDIDSTDTTNKRFEKFVAPMHRESALIISRQPNYMTCSMITSIQIMLPSVDEMLNVRYNHARPRITLETWSFVLFWNTFSVLRF